MKPAKIVGYFEGRGHGYAVYPDGAVWTKIQGHNWPTPKITRRKPSVNPVNGYHSCGNVYVHRAVALAFIENPYGLSDVNHKDGNKANNHVTNLEWLSRRDNHRHAYRTGLRKPASKHTFGKGVSWDRVKNKWTAKASRFFIGYFTVKDEAHAAVEAWWAAK